MLRESKQVEKGQLTQMHITWGIGEIVQKYSHQNKNNMMDEREGRLSRADVEEDYHANRGETTNPLPIKIGTSIFGGLIDR
jgi:hypothetical protein